MNVPLSVLCVLSPFGASTSAIDTPEERVHDSLLPGDCLSPQRPVSKSQVSTVFTII